MEPPTIDDARKLGRKLGARGVIVLCFDTDRIAGVSYGRTKADCKNMGRLLDALATPIEDGEIKVWA